MVTDRYQHVRHHPTLDAFAAWTAARDLPVIGIDNLPGAEPIDAYPLPERCALLFGQEGPGLSPDARRLCTAVLAIRQFGSTRSINAAAASAVAMHEWIRRHAERPAAPAPRARPRPSHR
jgi:tRNA G18 (ribose-2'-O)-methylase SpoU